VVCLLAADRGSNLAIYISVILIRSEITKTRRQGVNTFIAKL